MLVNRRSPGFGLTLVAEMLNGTFLSAEMSSTPQGQGDPILPEDLGRNCAKLLLEEVYRVSTAETLTYSAYLFHTHSCHCCGFGIVCFRQKTSQSSEALLHCCVWCLCFSCSITLDNWKLFHYISDIQSNCHSKSFSCWKQIWKWNFICYLYCLDFPPQRMQYYDTKLGFN